MIPKHGFACLLLLMTVSCNSPGFAAAVGSDTTISAMEKKLFSHSYAGETDSNRINRLEKFVFGAESPDNSINDRQARLASCVPLKSSKTSAASATATARVTTSDASANLANVSSYPRVTQLEMRLLGKSYFGEAIAKRLSRLEISEFGKPSTSNDLAARMDILSAIAKSNADKTKLNELASFQSPNVAVENFRSHVYKTFQDGPAAPAKEQPNTVVDQIEYLESAAFGKIRTNKTLQKRVDALEEKYYGAMKVADKNLTYRVAQLLSMINSNSRAVQTRS